MKIFNVNRMLALKSNSLKKYFFYALGEILLIVAGVAIGLHVNKLKEKNIKQKKINNYYLKINEEATALLLQIENNNKYSRILVEGLQYNLNSIANQKTDSLFIENLTYLTDIEQQTFFFPIIDEFLEQGYLSSIKDISLIKTFNYLEYFREQSDLDDSKLMDFNNLLLPTLASKLNFLDIDWMNYADKTNGFERLQYATDFENDYEALSKDLAIWNLIIYRMDIEKNRIINNKHLENTLIRIKEKTDAGTAS